ncbi:MAG: ribosomal-processing cysteine protease Prp [Faecalibacterium sp.]
MIRATVARTVWNSGVTGYEVKAEGHAGAGEYGQDIVCAAVSVLLQTLANEVTEAARAGLLAVGVVAHGDGWMKVEMPPPPTRRRTWRTPGWSWCRTALTPWPRATRRTWNWRCTMCMPIPRNWNLTSWRTW